MPLNRLGNERHAVAKRLSLGNLPPDLGLSLLACVASDCKTHPRIAASRIFHKLPRQCSALIYRQAAQLDNITQPWFRDYPTNVCGDEHRPRLFVKSTWGVTLKTSAECADDGCNLPWRN